MRDTGLMRLTSEVLELRAGLRRLEAAEPPINVAAGKTLKVEHSMTLTGADGRILTIPATGTAALLGTANVFTEAQYFGTGASGAQVAIKSQAVNTVGLVVDTAASPTANVAEFKNNGTIMYRFASDYSIQMAAYDNGASYGPYITINRNNNATTPAAGFVFLFDKGGTPHRIWVDDPGNLRISPSVNPTNANDTAGTVVGTQTSQAATKDILGDGVSPDAALAAILRAPVYEFRYKSGAYNSTVFYGITTDDSPEFGMDEGRVFNPVSAFGYTVQAIKALARLRIDSSGNVGTGNPISTDALGAYYGRVRVYVEGVGAKWLALYD